MVSIIRCCNQYQLNKKHITGKENSCLNAKKVFRSLFKIETRFVRLMVVCLIYAM